MVRHANTIVKYIKSMDVEEGLDKTPGFVGGLETPLVNYSELATVGSFPNRCGTIAFYDSSVKKRSLLLLTVITL